MGENRYFIAIAGAAGAGKTTVSKIIKDRGFHVVFTDQNVRKALNSLPVIKELEKYIGSGIFENGKLNFKKISAYFEDHYEDECRFEEWFQPYYGKQIIEQLNQTKEKIVFVDIPLLFYKRIEEYFYSIWWLDSDFLVENIRNRNHYNDRKILNLIQFSSKNKRMPNCCVIQNNSSIEELKTKIDKEIEKLMEEITFSEVVNDVLLALNEKTKIAFQHAICPDIFVGLNGEFWFDKQSRIEHQDRLKIKAKTESEKTIVVILESPHVDEFQDSKISPNPALGTTGNKLQRYFTDKSLRDLLGKKLPKKYKVILMNSIQYQCSLGLGTKKYRDHIWISCWYKFGRESFIKRLKSYKPDVIINLCTKGNHSEEPGLPCDCNKHNINKKYLLHCCKSSFDKQPELKKIKKITLQNVNNYDFFRNPIEARDLIIDALEIQKFEGSNVYDGELDGRMVKIMPVNRIATKADLSELIANMPYKTFEQRKKDNPSEPVEKITIVCMGHEADLKAHLDAEVTGFKLDVTIVDILRDKADLQLKREAEAVVERVGNKLIVKEFYPMNLMQKLSLQKEYVEEWKQLVESIMVDFNYDGAVLQPAVTDIPGKNEFVAGEYDIPEDAGTIRIKITDLLSESLEVEVK